MLTKVKNVLDITADTMVDLLSAKHKKGSVQLLGYHERGDGGGGVFYWDADKPKTEHNGGTVVDPTVSFPNDWSDTAQQELWFTAPTSGTGCWVREFSGAVNVKWFGAKGDYNGTLVTNDTIAIQKAADSIVGTGTVFIPATEGEYYYYSSYLLIPLGVDLKGEGRALANTTIEVVGSLQQTYGNTVSDMLLRGCRVNYTAQDNSLKIIEGLTLNPNNFTIENVMFDGVQFAGGSIGGDCITLSGVAWDLLLSHVYIVNYGGAGLKVLSDNTGTTPPYVATGVFTKLVNTKIVNCGYGVWAVDASADSTDIHLHNVLLDNCVTGLKASNQRLAGMGELQIFGSGVRVELASDKAIENDGAYFSIHNLWAFGGKAGSDPTKYIHNISGQMYLDGRVSCPVFAEDGAFLTVNGEIGGSILNNVKKGLQTQDVLGKELATVYFVVEKNTAGFVDVNINSSDTYGIGSNKYSNSVATGVGEYTGVTTVGSGISEVSYQMFGQTILGVSLSDKVYGIGAVSLVYNSTNTHLFANARSAGGVLPVPTLAIDWTDISGTGYSLLQTMPIGSKLVFSVELLL